MNWLKLVGVLLWTIVPALAVWTGWLNYKYPRRPHFLRRPDTWK